MVFLPCPKFQRGGRRSSDTEDGPVVDGITERDVPETISQLSVNDSERDREALADIFGQPTPQSSRNRIRIPFRSRSLINRHPSIARTKSRVSMRSISSKLRRRFSRDANLAKKPSRVTIARTQEVFESEGGGDAGYDSDAHCILTPQITEALSESPYSVAKRREPHGKQAQRTSTLLSGVIDAEGAPECTGTAGARTPLPKDLDSADKNSTPAHSRKGTHTATGTPRAFEKKPHNAVYGTPADSCLENFFTPPDGRSPADSDGRTNKPYEGLDSASPRLQQSATHAPSFDCLYPVPERPPPPIPCRHPARRASVQGTPESRTKLIYSERPPSFNLSRPEPRQTTPQGNQGSAVIRSNDVLEPMGAIESTALNGAGPMKTEVNGDKSDGGPQGQAKSPKIPLAPVPKGFAGGAQTNNLGKLHVAKRNSIAVRQSRFREDFEVSYTEEAGPKNLARSNTTREQHRSSSEGWLSGGRRLGYGYNFVPGAGSPAKRAIQGQQNAVNNEQQKDDRTPVESPGRAVANSKELFNGPAAEINEDTDTAPLTALPDCPVDTTDPNTKAAQVKRSFSLRSWAKFPQSGKKERNSLAAVHDATVPDASDTEVTATEAESAKTTPKGARGKGLFRNLSLARGKNILKKHESVPSELVEFGKTARGEGSSSTSTREQLTERASGATSSQDASLGHVRGSSTYSPLLRPGGYDGPLNLRLHPLPSLDRSSENQDPAAPMTDMGTAESWSQLYQDCLPESTVSGESEALAAAERERSATEEREADAGKKRVASALASSTAMQAAMAGHKEPNRTIQGRAREGLR